MFDNINVYFQKNKKAFQFNPKLNKFICKSVHFKNRERFILAKEEHERPIVPVSNIVNLVNDFLISIGIKPVDEKLAIMNPREVCYEELKKRHHLADERDLVWLKFTTSGHIGVVACSNDIGFDLPRNESEYNEKVIEYNKYTKSYEDKWKYTTSGILIHSVGEKWEESFVLVFPLERSKRACQYKRHEIETAIGNYLEKNNVPIIDYYSHNYG